MELTRNQQCMIEAIARTMEAYPDARDAIRSLLTLLIQWNTNGELTDEIVQRALTLLEVRS